MLHILLPHFAEETLLYSKQGGGQQSWGVDSVDAGANLDVAYLPHFAEETLSYSKQGGGQQSWGDNEVVDCVDADAY